MGCSRVGLDVVSPWVEGVSSGDIESGVMPGAGKDTVFDGAFRQWESHVRTAVINCVEFLIVVEYPNRVTVNGHDGRGFFVELVGGTDFSKATGYIRHG